MAAGPEQLRGLPQPSSLYLVRLGGMGLVCWSIYSEVRPGTTGTHLAVWILVASLVPALLAWTTGEVANPIRQALAFAWLGAAGGAVAVFAPIALAIVGSAALGAAASYELPAALGFSLLGSLGMGVTVLVEGRPLSTLLGGLGVGFAGLVVGVARRQSNERAAQAVVASFEHERAELEAARADVLAERNRLAREVHDVLAHTLGALAIQLEALDSGAEMPEPLRDGLRRTKSLAADGLAEARRAVQALRDDAAPLDAQLDKLCEVRGAELAITGCPRALSPEATLALYRVAQESLTNAAKHAPGAQVAVRLGYEQGLVVLAVENGPSESEPGELARSGAGYGLDGIRERVRLLGGEVAAGSAEGGWRVEARLQA